MMVRHILIIVGVGLGLAVIAGVVASQHHQRAAPDEQTKIRVLFAGDTSFAETYRANRGKPRTLAVYTRYFEGLAGLAARADLAILNLETPLSRRRKSPFDGKKKYLHRDDPELVPATLCARNFSAVSLANNHAMDYGGPGMGDTLEALERGGLLAFGAGLNEAEASKPFVRRLDLGTSTFTLAVVAGFEYRRKYDEKLAYYAGANEPGVNLWTMERAVQQVRDARRLNERAFIVAYPHWGRNYRWRRKDQVDLAHALVDAGANLVVGHGAHRLQEVERYHGRIIVYSIGNFVLNTPGRYQKLRVHPFSAAAMLEIGEVKGARHLVLKLYPIFSDNLVTHYAPRLVTKEEIDRLRKLLLPERLPGLTASELIQGRDGLGHYLALSIEAQESRP